MNVYYVYMQWWKYVFMYMYVRMYIRQEVYV